MTERPYEFVTTPEGPVLRVRARGTSVLATPILNRGTAFTLAERRALGLVGLPEGTSTIDGQVRRVYAQFQRQPDPLAKNVYLANLRDRNEVLFYRLLSEFLSVDHPDLIEESFRNYGLGPDDVDTPRGRRYSWL
jgi:malate dehydrogenase (oxaloacetate-decarboxylating)